MKFKNISIRKKFLLIYLLTAVIMLFFEMMNFMLVNRSVKEIDQVISTNLGANKLTESLKSVQNTLYSYLVSADGGDLENYYRCEMNYQEKTQNLNNAIYDNEYLLCEKNIRDISESYLEMTDAAVMAKRGRNIAQYKYYYEKSQYYYHILQSHINTMNNKKLDENSVRYRFLCNKLRKLELFGMLGILTIAIVCVIVINVYIANLIRPLTMLAKTAKIISSGNYDLEVEEVPRRDEVGIVVHTFNIMIYNIKQHMNYIRETTIKEREMKENELRMEVLLNDAKLKYLRAQINPHFLYNALNTCEQLANLENADQTAEFVERMAFFFRYNVRRTVENDNPLEDEIRAVDAYMYIQNVRFGGTIEVIKDIEEGTQSRIVPTMILQPAVENAVQHGFKNQDRSGIIHFSIKTNEVGDIIICIEDNGCGMTQEQIEAIMNKPLKEEKKKENMALQEQTGIGVANVRQRLELYYGKENLFKIESDGLGQGTKVWIRIPAPENGGTNVPDTISR